jgi:hypothetical protein
MTSGERSGQWAAYNRMLNWINAQDDMCLLCRKLLQKQLMSFRPEEIKEETL